MLLYFLVDLLNAENADIWNKRQTKTVMIFCYLFLLIMTYPAEGMEKKLLVRLVLQYIFRDNMQQINSQYDNAIC